MVALIQIGDIQVETRPCGDCSLCCKLPHIDAVAGGDMAFPFYKPAGQWCKHCAPSKVGCKIHSTPDFPNLCRNYLCLWKFPGSGLLEEDHPDKIKAILTMDEPLPDFPGTRIFRVQFDTDHPPTDEARKIIRDGLERGHAFVLITANKGAVMARNDALRQKIVEREEARPSGCVR